MKSYLESILSSDTQINEENISLNEKEITGGTNTITMICMLDGTISVRLKKYLEKKNIDAVDIRTVLPGLFIEVYNELENKYYTNKEILDMVSQKVFEYIETKSKISSVFILPCNKPSLDIIRLFKDLKKKMKLNLYFLNLSTELLFELFYESNDKLQIYQPTHALLGWITVYYKKNSSKTENSIYITRTFLKKCLLRKKYFFSNEESLNESINILFNYFNEQGEELFLEFYFTSDLEVTFINIERSDNIENCFNEMHLV